MPNQHQINLPDATTFRGWLLQSLRVLECSPHQLCAMAQVGNNTARKFISKEQADLRLNTAATLVRTAQKMARAKGVALPDIPQNYLKSQCAKSSDLQPDGGAAL